MSDGVCIVLESGSQSLKDMITSARKGVLPGRLSGGAPADKGDFSGIAKNSCYIPGGKIQFPPAETMVSGNMATILKNITEVSKEMVDFGDGRYPWLKATDVSFS